MLRRDFGLNQAVLALELGGSTMGGDAMNQKMKPRLGRGLSALIGQPVAVTVPESTAKPTPQTGSRQNADVASKPPSIAMESDRGRVLSVGVDLIQPNRHQPRQSFDDATLAQLAESIRTAGLMQPVLVRRREQGEKGAASGFELIAGERRWRAARLAGLREIPAIEVGLTDREAAEWALIENLQREDLNPIDRAAAFKGLADRFGLTQAEIAERVGVDRSTIANTVRLLDLEREVRELVAHGALSMGHAKALLSGPAGNARVAAALDAVREGWTVRDTERWGIETQKQGVAVPKRTAPAPVSAAVADLERQLGEHLGTRVRLKRGRSARKGRLIIEFYSDDHFEGLMGKLGFRLSS